MVLASLGEGIDVRSTVDVICHALKTCRNRDLVVHQPGEWERISIGPVLACEDTLVEMPVQVAGMSRVYPSELIVNRCSVVG